MVLFLISQVTYVWSVKVLCQLQIKNTKEQLEKLKPTYGYMAITCWPTNSRQSESNNQFLVQVVNAAHLLAWLKIVFTKKNSAVWLNP